jgi:hypothetical protein
MLASGVVEWGHAEGQKAVDKEGQMKDYIIKANIKLEVKARNEDEAKEMAMEDLRDFLRHHSLDDLLEVLEK